MEKFFTKDWLDYLGDRAEIGDYSYGNPRVLHWSEKTKLRIGRFCSIAENVTIFLGGNHRTDWITTFPFGGLKEIWHEGKEVINLETTKGDVVIGNDVWIGFGSTILSGVKIGDGAVVGASAVVAKDVSPYSIVIGNPAREVRKRFNEEIIAKLLKIKWWSWSEQKIRQNIGLLCSGNIDKFFNNHEMKN